MGRAGLSLSDALRSVQYADLRATFGPADLRSLLAENPELAETWFAYSEDKRTSSGWYLLRSGEIGQLGNPASHARFDSVEEAVGEYVVRELDFWAGLRGAG